MATIPVTSRGWSMSWKSGLLLGGVLLVRWAAE